MKIPASRPEIDNRIANQLAWSMIGRKPSPVCLKNRVRKPRDITEARFIRAPSNRVNGFVFQQEQRFLACDQTAFQPLFLQVERCLVLDSAKALDLHNALMPRCCVTGEPCI